MDKLVNEQKPKNKEDKLKIDKKNNYTRKQLVHNTQQIAHEATTTFSIRPTGNNTKSNSQPSNYYHKRTQNVQLKSLKNTV